MTILATLFTHPRVEMTL